MSVYDEIITNLRRRVRDLTADARQVEKELAARGLRRSRFGIVTHAEYSRRALREIVSLSQTPITKDDQ